MSEEQARTELVELDRHRPTFEAKFDAAREAFIRAGQELHELGIRFDRALVAADAEHTLVPEFVRRPKQPMPVTAADFAETPDG